MDALRSIHSRIILPFPLLSCLRVAASLQLSNFPLSLSIIIILSLLSPCCALVL